MAEKMSTSQDEVWTSVIERKSGWFSLHLLELLHYRDLVWLFVKRDFVSIYKQTVLGPIWFVIQPLMTTVVFTIVFSKLARISTDEIPAPLFYMAGTIAWTYFSTCMTQTSKTFLANALIFSKVYFPRIAIPVSVVISNLISFGLQLLFFLGFVLFYYLKGSTIHLTWWVLYVPILIIQMAALSLGMGVLISSLTTKYRDLQFVTGFGVQLWMYATPIVYPLSVAPAKWKWILSLNPMAPIIETFRHAFLGAGDVNILRLGISAIITLMILAVGLIIFGRVERNFIDTV